MFDDKSTLLKVVKCLLAVGFLIFSTFFLLFEYTSLFTQSTDTLGLPTKGNWWAWFAAAWVGGTLVMAAWLTANWWFKTFHRLSALLNGGIIGGICIIGGIGIMLIIGSSKHLKI